MKVRNISIYALAMGLLCMVSCKKEEVELRQMVFKASLEQGSQKTSLSGLDIHWTANDSVLVLATGNSPVDTAKFKAQTGGSSVTEFTGSISGSQPYYAVYPYGRNVSYTSGSLTGVVIPTEQTATPNTFDPRANVMVAKSSNTVLNFKNVCSYVKVTTGAAYKEICLKSNSSSDTLSGTFTVTVGDDGIPTSTVATGGVNYVKLVPASGTTIAAGTYVIAVASKTLSNGFSVECVRDDSIFIKRKTTSTTFNRSRLADYGTLGAWTEKKVNNFVNGHEYVDLGLSVKWATCNVGATNPQDYGDYFAWGETEKKDNYTQATYKYGDGSANYKFKKYCPSTSSSYLASGFSGDALTTLELSDDAARANWGGTWRMPTQAEMQKLIDSCTWTWTTNFNGSGMNGYVVTSKKIGYKDKSIFLPAAGYFLGTSLINAGSSGYYWSSSLGSSYPRNAWRLYFYGDFQNMNYYYRYNGHTVRPVCE